MQRWQPKYLVLYDGSKSGIKRLELFDSEIKFKKQIPAKIIPLLECIRVVTCQRQKTTYTFEVSSQQLVSRRRRVGAHSTHFARGLKQRDFRRRR